MHSVCSVAGWGRLDINGSLSNRLMETHVKIMNNTKCENKWGEDDYSASQMMCTYGNGGSCTVSKRSSVILIDIRPQMVSLIFVFTLLTGGFRRSFGLWGNCCWCHIFW